VGMLCRDAEQFSAGEPRRSNDTDVDLRHRMIIQSTA
jgi:hypothetical protein